MAWFSLRKRLSRKVPIYQKEQWTFKVIVQQVLVEIVHIGQQKAWFECYEISPKSHILRYLTHVLTEFKRERDFCNACIHLPLQTI